MVGSSDRQDEQSGPLISLAIPRPGIAITLRLSMVVKLMARASSSAAAAQRARCRRGLCGQWGVRMRSRNPVLASTVGRPSRLRTRVFHDGPYKTICSQPRAAPRIGTAENLGRFRMGGQGSDDRRARGRHDYF